MLSKAIFVGYTLDTVTMKGIPRYFYLKGGQPQTGSYFTPDTAETELINSLEGGYIDYYPYVKSVEHVCDGELTVILSTEVYIPDLETDSIEPIEIVSLELRKTFDMGDLSSLDAEVYDLRETLHLKVAKVIARNSLIPV